MTIGDATERDARVLAVFEDREGEISAVVIFYIELVGARRYFFHKLTECYRMLSVHVAGDGKRKGRAQMLEHAFYLF